jgi:hypothetical protein
MNLKELPLFNNSKATIKRDYDFTKALDFDMVNVSASIKKDRIDKLVRYCNENDLDLNQCIDSMIKHYLDNK